MKSVKPFLIKCRGIKNRQDVFYKKILQGKWPFSNPEKGLNKIFFGGRGTLISYGIISSVERFAKNSRMAQSTLFHADSFVISRKETPFFARMAEVEFDSLSTHIFCLKMHKGALGLINSPLAALVCDHEQNIHLPFAFYFIPTSFTKPKLTFSNRGNLSCVIDISKNSL